MITVTKMDRRIKWACSTPLAWPAEELRRTERWGIRRGSSQYFNAYFYRMTYNFRLYFQRRQAKPTRPAAIVWNHSNKTPGSKTDVTETKHNTMREARTNFFVFLASIKLRNQVLHAREGWTASDSHSRGRLPSFLSAIVWTVFFSGRTLAIPWKSWSGYLMYARPLQLTSLKGKIVPMLHYAPRHKRRVGKRTYCSMEMSGQLHALAILP
jgi:hypothetical protein